MSSINSFATDFYGQLAKVVKAVGNKSRLEILVLLAQGERTVDSIAREIQHPVTNTSHHLRDLREIGIVDNRKEGVNVIYSLADDSVYGLVVSICETAEKKSQQFKDVVERYLNRRDDLKSLTAEELVAKLAERNLTILDVRPEEEFKAGHLPGAINLTLDEIGENIYSLIKGKDVIAYCRGPYCILAYEAVARLRSKGVTAYRLKDGFPEWRRHGLPIETS